MSIRELYIPTKKASRQKSNSSLNNIITQTIISPQNVKIEVEEPQPSFLAEISDIMCGFGDCDRPRRESVQLVEKIVNQQLRGILSEAIDASINRRDQAAPSLVDFEFLMRQHPVKINRMRKYIKDMRFLKKTHNLQAGIQPYVTENDPSRDSDDDAEIEVAEIHDEEKMRRLFRADRISQILSDVQYKEYNESRKTSFYCRNSERMRHKLRKFLNVPAEIRLTNLCLTTLSYLAHETIAAIVDLAILTRLNSENRITDPYSRITSADASYGMMHVCPEVTQGRGMEGVQAITVSEIHEAMRRFAMFSRRPMGLNRSGQGSKSSYLAI